MRFGRILASFSMALLAVLSFALPFSVHADALPSETVDKLCKFAGADQMAACRGCFEKDPPQTWSAIGCIPSTPQGLANKFLSVGAGLAGGIAMILILFGGLQIMTSAGNPEKLNEGKELTSAAITGLILIIFSVFILKVIGVDILGIPGFQ